AAFHLGEVLRRDAGAGRGLDEALTLLVAQVAQFAADDIPPERLEFAALACGVDLDQFTHDGSQAPEPVPAPAVLLTAESARFAVRPGRTVYRGIPRGAAVGERVVVLDDYQGVAGTIADWAPIRSRADVVFQREHAFSED